MIILILNNTVLNIYLSMWHMLGDNMYRKLQNYF